MGQCLSTRRLSSTSTAGADPAPTSEHLPTHHPLDAFAVGTAPAAEDASVEGHPRSSSAPHAAVDSDGDVQDDHVAAVPSQPPHTPEPQRNPLASLATRPSRSPISSAPPGSFRSIVVQQERAPPLIAPPPPPTPAAPTLEAVQSPLMPTPTRFTTGRIDSPFGTSSTRSRPAAVHFNDCCALLSMATSGPQPNGVHLLSATFENGSADDLGMIRTASPFLQSTDDRSSVFHSAQDCSGFFMSSQLMLDASTRFVPLASEGKHRDALARRRLVDCGTASHLALRSQMCDVF